MAASWDHYRSVTQIIALKPGFHMIATIATIAAQRSQRSLRSLRAYGNIHSAIFAIVATLNRNDRRDRNFSISAIVVLRSLRSLRCDRCDHMETRLNSFFVSEQNDLYPLVKFALYLKNLCDRAFAFTFTSNALGESLFQLIHALIDSVIHE